MYSIGKGWLFSAMILSVFLCYVLTTVAVSASSPKGGDPPTTLISSGKIVGEIETFSSDFMKLNKRVVVYHGIPYAEPPVGDRRFRRPVPVEPWEGVYEAVEMPPGCPQTVPSHLEHIDAAEMKSENCLFLNAFVPLPTPANASIMVYIHGGGMSWGTGLNYPADPLPLAAVGDVIVVTINYRLGAFGFLSTGDDVIPPNLGLYDQRAALKWVHENAQAFGGDPNSITVFGNEAGASSIGWHLLSAESRQYFQRVILQSGSPFDNAIGPISPEEALERTNLSTALLGCSYKERSTKELLYRCLMDTQASDLVSVSLQVADIVENSHPWGLVTDDEFFTKSAKELINGGGFEHIDVMVGVNKNEGRAKIYEATGFPKEKPVINKDLFHKLSSQMEVNDSIRAFYLKDGLYNDDSDYFDVLSDMVTDTRYLCHIKEFASSLKTAGCRVYMYALTHDPETESVMRFPWAGAGPMEDLKYVFGLPFQTDLPFVITEVARVVSAHFMRSWTNFAKTGDPNFSGNPKQPISKYPSWPEFTFEKKEYKQMERELRNGENFQKEECRTLYHGISDINGELDKNEVPHSRKEETRIPSDEL